MSVTVLSAEALAALPLPPPPADGDKDDRGAILVAAGGGAVPGAPILTGVAALRVGAGKLKLLATRLTLASLGVAVPEARILLAPQTKELEIAAPSRRTAAEYVDHVDAVVVGPGMLGGAEPLQLAETLMACAPGAAFVIDAAALPRVADQKRFAPLAGGRTVLTPHAGEMATLLGIEKAQVLADPLAAAREAAAALRSVVVMKGATTFVVTPAGAAWRHDHGIPGLATSGSGDVLAGVIGGLLARGAPPAEAALWGVHLHASAGRRAAKKIGALGFLASDLLIALPRVMAAAKG